MKQKLLLLSLLTLLGSITANAAFVVDGIKYYTLTDNTVEVAPQSPKYSGSVTIPATVTYNNVTYSVSRIGMNAFFGCTGLISIEIPNSVTRICDYAFVNCTGLESIEIPSSVKMIDDGAFVGCSNLSSIIVNSGNTMYESPSGCNAIIKTSTHELVAGCKNTIIPNSVTSIGKSAFSSCTGLASIEIPNSVMSIGNSAFSGCSGLTSVLISDGVKSIGQAAFNNCSVLSSITIPNSVTSIGNQAFENTAWYNNQPDGLVYAGKVAYQYKGTMPDNTTIIIEDGTVSISNAAFYNCTGLFSVTIPNSVTSIGDHAFSSCTGLTSITIPNSVTSIGERAFDNCDGLTSINIPNSVTSIGNYAFYGCELLSSVALGNGITVIPASAFAYCRSLTSIEIPNNVTSIGENAFSYCTNMLSVIIPRSVTTICSNAFYNCTRLNSVVYEAEEPFVINFYIPFYNIPSTCTLTVPYGKRDTYIAAGWTEDIFKGGIVEATSVSITINSLGKGTYCSAYPLDFTDVSGINAYIISGFNPDNGRLILTRAYEIPAGTGLYVDGTPSTTYSIPIKATAFYYSNMLKGVLSNSTISANEDNYTNYVLSSDGQGGVIFKHANNASLPANRAYVQIPSSIVGAREFLGIETDNDSLTGLDGVFTPDTKEAEGDYYNLRGQKVQTPQRGIYIKNGKKYLFTKF